MFASLGWLKARPCSRIKIASNRYQLYSNSEVLPRCPLKYNLLPPVGWEPYQLGVQIRAKKECPQENRLLNGVFLCQNITWDLPVVLTYIIITLLSTVEAILVSLWGMTVNMLCTLMRSVCSTYHIVVTCGSVTRWLKYYSNFGHLQQWQFSP